MLSPEEFDKKFDEILYSFDVEFLKAWFEADAEMEEMSRLSSGEVVFYENDFQEASVPSFYLSGPDLESEVVLSDLESEVVLIAEGDDEQYDYGKAA